MSRTPKISSQLGASSNITVESDLIQMREAFTPTKSELGRPVGQPMFPYASSLGALAYL